MKRNGKSSRQQPSRQQVANALLHPKPKTAGYGPWPAHWHWAARDLPPFSFYYIYWMLMNPTIRLGLGMRAAPICSAEFAYKDGDKWRPGIKADDSRVGEFVLRQLQRIWTYDLEKILAAQVWGWSAGEVLYRYVDGFVEVDELLDRHARDSRALTRNGKVVGTQFDRIEGAGKMALYFPKCWFHGFFPEGGSPYGMSILRGAFSPWWDLWMEGGAEDVCRLFHHKDAYGGASLTYPGGRTIDSEGTEIPNQDIARQIGEQYRSGSVVILPFEDDGKGNNKWSFERATVPSNPTHVYNYPDKLEVRMLRGMEIPDDVLTADSDSSGAWAGKQVPQAAFHEGLQRWLNQIIKTVDSQIIRRLVLLNFGDANYEISTKPLALQGKEEQKPAQGGQTPFGASAQPAMGEAPGPGEQPARLSLGHAGGAVDAEHVADLAAGEIVGQAESIVRAAKAAIERRAGVQRMDSNGRWVTIGAKDGSGGTPVQLDESGNIVKGPSTLAGHNVNAIPKRKDLLGRESTGGSQRGLFGEETDTPEKKGPSRADREKWGDNVEHKPDGRVVGTAMLKPSDIVADPERFQFKVSGIGEEGVTEELKEIKRFRPEFAGQLLVWKDPEDGKTYVVNGHHRHELANRTGYKGKVPVFAVDAQNATEARALGALANIAEGRGTAVDAAKFMRDMGVGVSDIREHGISLKGKVADEGATLAQLSDGLFKKLVNEDIREQRALAIAKELGGKPELQDKLAKIIGKRDAKGRDVPDSVVAEMAREMAFTPTVKEEKADLFGSWEEEDSLFIERNELKSFVKSQLAEEKRTFKSVSRSGRDSRLQEAGNVLDSEKNKQIATAAGEDFEVFDKFANLRGPISDAINSAAAELRQNPKRRKQIGQRLAGEIRNLVRTADA